MRISEPRRKAMLNGFLSGLSCTFSVFHPGKVKGLIDSEVVKLLNEPSPGPERDMERLGEDFRNAFNKLNMQMRHDSASKAADYEAQAISVQGAQKPADQAAGLESFLPPPEMLEFYEKILPGFTDRLMTMAESEQSTRHAEVREQISAHEKQTAHAEDESQQIIRVNYLSQYFGFAALLACIVISAVLAFSGYSWQVCALFLAIPMVSYFVR